jgi:hypothetical protein
MVAATAAVPATATPTPSFAPDACPRADFHGNFVKVKIATQYGPIMFVAFVLALMVIWALYAMVSQGKAQGETRQEETRPVLV